MFSPSAAWLNLVQIDNDQSDYFIPRWNHLAVPVGLLKPCPILHLVVGRKWKIKPKDLNTFFPPFFGSVENESLRTDWDMKDHQLSARLRKHLRSKISYTLH